MSFALSLIIAFVLINILVAIPILGVLLADMQPFFGLFLPYLALAIFVVGLIWQVMRWANTPVPFRIPTTAGQAKSLPWIKPDYLDNPPNGLSAIIRMLLEGFAFRSLFRNSKMYYKPDGTIRYGSSKWLWIFAAAFHAALVVVLIRHLRFVLEPVPFWLQWAERIDGMFEMGLPLPLPDGMMMLHPTLLQSGAVLLGAAGVLLLRRLINPQARIISLVGDWFPLLLILGIAQTGIFMRHFTNMDVVAVKKLVLSLLTFSPALPEEPIGFLFYVHLFLVCVLIAYLPFSKLTHMFGLWLSPTRNLVNNSRAVRHVNPWNPQVKVRSYQEYEDEFREQMIEAGIPVEKES